MARILRFISIASKLAVQVTLLLGMLYSSIAPASATDADEIKNILDDYLAINEISGGVITINAPDLDVTIASGIAHRQRKTKMTTSKRFYLASLGKTMVAVAILDAVVKGEIELNSKVADLLSDFEDLQRLENIQEIIVAQLLNHSSGIAEYLDDVFWDTSLQQPDKKWNPAEALAFAHDHTTDFRAGTDFKYTNTNYVLLGAILEKLDGSLSASLAKRVFEPSGMATATIGADASDKSLARGYDGDGNDYSELVWHSPLGDGPVVGTTSDIRNFLDAAFINQTLLPPKMLKQMLKGSKHEKSYGLGIGIERDDFGLWYGHAGSYDGFESDFRYYPKHELTIIHTLNGNITVDAPLSDILADWYLGE